MELEQELTETKQRLSKVTREYDMVKLKLGCEKDQVIEAKDARAVAEKRLLNTEAQFTSVSEKLKEKERQLERTEETLIDLKKILSTTKARLAETENSILPSAQATIADLRSQHTTLLGEKQGLEKDIEQLNAEVRELRMAVTALEMANKRLSTTARQREGLEEQLVKHKAARATLEVEKERILRRLQAAIDRGSEKAIEISRLKRKVAKMAKELFMEKNLIALKTYFGRSRI
ncbi:hypothetical protein VTJ83DRAFT_2883 [Remersonia thermophila]|uniref:Uncharacterized protein n=1 Tax=Remersonia thermophila TaxID=72144 RepID=A0ABR4DEN1_9PEZI